VVVVGHGQPLGARLVGEMQLQRGKRLIESMMCLLHAGQASFHSRLICSKVVTAGFEGSQLVLLPKPAFMHCSSVCRVYSSRALGLDVCKALDVLVAAAQTDTRS